MRLPRPNCKPRLMHMVPIVYNDTVTSRRFRNSNSPDAFQIVVSRIFFKLKYVVLDRTKVTCFFFLLFFVCDKKKSVTKLRPFQRFIVRYQSSWKTNPFLLENVIPIFGTNRCNYFTLVPFCRDIDIPLTQNLHLPSMPVIDTTM